MEFVIKNFIEVLSSAADFLFPMMVLAFMAGVILRVLIHYTVQRQDWFTRNFEKRTRKFLEERSFKNYDSFYITTKTLLEKTYYELFIFRAINKRRNPDVILDMSDRLFLIQHGTAFFVGETLRNIKFWKYGDKDPRFKDSSINILKNNPCFNRAIGVFPVGPFTDILNLLPGIFLVGGIFGTFLGIMAALPELQGMDMADIESSQKVMGRFLDSISFSMSTSIMGILLSVTMNVINTILNPEKLFLNIVERLEATLEIIWDSCEHNTLPKNIENFDENRDSIDVLAEEAIKKEMSEQKKRLSWGSGNPDEKTEKVIEEVKAGLSMNTENPDNEGPEEAVHASGQESLPGMSEDDTSDEENKKAS
ncbi:hypothetical protein N9N67_01270 [Bacteriovoracaceae bacterium]|nr:hypothetical protein [Bacteriovoracaceae bacterium]